LKRNQSKKTAHPQLKMASAGWLDAIEIRDDIGFFQAVKAALAKPRGERKATEDLDHAVR